MRASSRGHFGCVEHLDGAAERGEFTRERAHVVTAQLDLDPAVGLRRTELHTRAEDPAAQILRVARDERAHPQRRAPLIDLLGNEAPRVGEVEAVGPHHPLAGRLDHRDPIDAERTQATLGVGDEIPDRTFRG